MPPVRDVMTASPERVKGHEPIGEAARRMRDVDVGAIVVTGRTGSPVGILTDRDIVVRAVAERKDLEAAPVSDIQSEELVMVGPDEEQDRAVELMRSAAVRRLLVVEDDEVVGICSIGDLAVERDPDSALADVSRAEPNR